MPTLVNPYLPPQAPSPLLILFLQLIEIVINYEIPANSWSCYYLWDISPRWSIRRYATLVNQGVMPTFIPMGH